MLHIAQYRILRVKKSIHTNNHAHTDSQLKKSGVNYG